jgi:hypothetical protein
VKGRMFFSFFCCHEEKERAVAFDLIHYAADAHLSDKWMYLMNKYAELPNNDCALAREIRNHVQNKFPVSNIQTSTKVLHRYRYGDFYEKIDLEPAMVARQMQQIILQHFYPGQQADGLSFLLDSPNTLL